MADDGWDVSDAISTATPTAAPAGAPSDGWEVSDAIHAPAPPTTSAYEAAGGRSTWGDVLQGVVAGGHGVAADFAGSVAAIAPGSRTGIEAQQYALGQQQAQEEAEQGMSPAAQRPGFLAHPLVSSAEALPGAAAVMVPAAIGSAILGPVGAGIATSTLMGSQQLGGAQNRAVGQGIELTPAEKVEQFGIGFVSGVVPELNVAGKIATGPLAKGVLEGGIGAGTFGAAGVGSEAVSETGEIGAGKREGYDPSAILTAGGTQALQGAGVGLGVIFHGKSKAGVEAKTPELTQGVDNTATGGEVTNKRTPTDYRKPEVSQQGGKPPVDAAAPRDKPTSAEAASPPPVTIENKGIGPAENAALNPEPVTPRVSEPLVAPVQSEPVVQPTVEIPQDQQGRPPAGIEPSELPPPKEDRETQPLPSAAPPREDVGALQPESDATRREQFDALIDKTNPRDIMVYDKGVQPFDLPNKKRYGQTELADGRIAQFDKYGAHNLLNADKVNFIDQQGKLGEVLGLGPVSKDEALARVQAGETPAIVTERTPAGTEVKGAVGTTETAPAQQEALELTKTPGNVTGVERPEDNLAAQQAAVAQEQRVQPQVVPPPKEVTPEGKLPVAPAGRVLEAQDEAGIRARNEAAMQAAQQVRTVEDELKRKNAAKEAAAAKEAGVKGRSHAGQEAIDATAKANETAQRIVDAYPHTGSYADTNAVIARAKAIAREAGKESLDVPKVFGEGHPWNAAMVKIREAKDLLAPIKKHLGETREDKLGRFIDREHMIDTGRVDEALASRRAEGAQGLGSPEGGAEGVRAKGGAVDEEGKPTEEREGEVREETPTEHATGEGVGGEERAPSPAEPRERPAVVSEAKEGQHYTAGKAAVGFQVAKTKSRAIKRQELEEDERPEAVMVKDYNNNINAIAPLRTTTASQALNKYYDPKHYSSELRPMMDRLRNALEQTEGDQQTHFISHNDMKDVFGRPARGLYDGDSDSIFINAEHASHDTVMHEMVHSATYHALERDPRLNNLFKRLWHEMDNAIPEGINVGKDVEYALSDPHELLTMLMTNPATQNLLKRIKISDELARDIGIPKWRKMTLWEGALNIFRKALGLGPRDISAIEAAASITEQALWKRDPGMAMEAAGRLGRAEEGTKLVSLPRIKFQKILSEGADKEDLPSGLKMGGTIRKMGTDAFQDMKVNAGSWWKKAHLNVMPASWVEGLYGHKFDDGGKENILAAAVNAQEGRHQEFRKLSDADMPFRTRIAEVTKQYEDRMNDFAKLLNMSDKFNIHADQDLKPSKAMDNWQQQQYHEEAQALLHSMPEDLQKFYSELKGEYRAKAQAIGTNHIEKLLNLFQAPDGLTNKEAIKLALDRNLTDDHMEHYDELGVGDEIRKASRLLDPKLAYFNAFREGDHVVVGTHDMPDGGHSVDATGAKLNDNTREFDTQAEAEKFTKGTELKATPSGAYYFKDPQGNLVKQIKDPASGKIVKASSTEHDVHKYQVTLQTEHMEQHTSAARAQRAREEMLANGVKNVSEVLDKRKDGNWGRMIGSAATAFERRIKDMNLSPAEERSLIDASRHISLASMSGNKLSNHWMGKRYVSGADYQSVYEGFRDYSNAANYHIANSNAQPAINAALERLDAHADANRQGPDAGLISSITNNFKERLAGGSASVSPKTPWWLHALRVLAFSKYLLTPKWIIQHQMHPFAYTAPMMAGRHGYADAVKYLFQAGKDVGGNWGNIKTGMKSSYEMARTAMGLGDEDQRAAGATPLKMVDRIIAGLTDKNAREGAAMRQADQWGLLHSGFDEEVYGTKGWGKLDAVMRQTTNAMEATNRTRAFLGSYRAEFDKLTQAGKSVNAADAAAKDYARKIVRDSMGVFTPSNMAPMLRNPYVRSMMQFKQFPMQQNYAILKNVYHAFKGDTPEVKREAVKAIGYQLTSSAVMAGVHGLPLLGLLKGVGLLGSALGVTPAPSDIDDKTYRWLADNLSPGFAKSIMSGAPAMAGNWAPDLTNMFGYSGDMFYGEPKDNHIGDYVMQQLGGAPFSTISDTMKGVKDAWDGDLVKGAGEMMPIRLFADPLKGYALGTQGMVSAGGRQIMPASPEAGALVTMGLSPLAREYAYQKYAGAQQAIKNQPKTVQEQLKAKAAAKKANTYPMGIKPTAKNKAILQEYERAYQ